MRDSVLYSGHQAHADDNEYRLVIVDVASELSVATAWPLAAPPAVAAPCLWHVRSLRVQNVGD